MLIKYLLLSPPPPSPATKKLHNIMATAMINDAGNCDTEYGSLKVQPTRCRPVKHQSRSRVMTVIQVLNHGGIASTKGRSFRLQRRSEQVVFHREQFGAQV